MKILKFLLIILFYFKIKYSKFLIADDAKMKKDLKFLMRQQVVLDVIQ